MPEIKLKSCPFCGGRASLTPISRRAIAYVICKRCLAQTSPQYGDECEARAIDLWNKRVNGHRGFLRRLRE